MEERFTTAGSSRRDAAVALAHATSRHDEAAIEAANQAFKTYEGELRAARAEALQLVRETTGDATYSDVNYVFPTFITTRMPAGLIGLLFAAIFAAAMSTIAGELSALSTASIIDFYRRFIRREASDHHFLVVSRFATAFWGIFASLVAIWAAELGSLIEVVNRFGSFFYGSILGVFILAVAMPRATANGAFIGLLAGMASVAYAATYTKVAFLWHNVVGAVAVVLVGTAISLVWPNSKSSPRSPGRRFS